ncbi:uncharacterized protein M6B38_105680 [Iris pallida]|uniref:Uncharacterized protein n=1 Tax=Iris pallida TaxID=29817 RepID=A0AAX6ERK1_IRIPA|nr:uncharacterized protein M6B38_105680 [Iris pallida]
MKPNSLHYTPPNPLLTFLPSPTSTFSSPPPPPPPQLVMMAKESMEDGEFWLPSDFLDNDGLLTTESEEEVYLASLVSKSRIEDSPQVLATSPQSTLGSWSFSSSPELPSTPFAKPGSSSDNALEVLYQAAGQVVRLGLNGGRERRLLGQPTKASLVHDKEALIQQQLRAAHFYQLKKQQLLKQQYAAVAAAAAWGRQSRARQYGVRPQSLSSAAWPPLRKEQQQHPHHHQNLNGSGMRAVFLNGTAARKESAGTGVFLPRRVGASNEPKKKPACSTVLLPARVIQALNLNLPASGYVLDHDVMSSVAKRNHHYAPQAAPAAAASHEIRLPPEWTY